MELITVVGLGIGGYLLKKLLEPDEAAKPSQPTYSNIVKKDPINLKLKNLLLENKIFFDELLDYPLTKEQRVSILDARKQSLVLASAGCGKTSVLIAKYAYLHQRLGIPTSKILLLAFNKSVKDELIERLKAMGVKEANIHTFHSFGRNILETQNQPIRLSKFANEESSGLLRTELIRQLLRSVCQQDISFLTDIFHLRGLARYQPIETFSENLDDYYRKISSYPYKRDKYRVDDYKTPLIPSLGGKVFVRSQQELVIANWFIFNGIEFRYEPPYPDAGFDYSPDFYIPEADLYIEHFAIDRDGNSPFEGYADDVEAKKAFHKSRTSHFECTYSYEYYEDTIIKKLEGILDKYKVPLNPLNNSDIQELIDDMEVESFYVFLAEMIKLIKSSSLSDEEILSKLNGLKDRFRANRFSRLIIPLMHAYQEMLEKSNEIDFDDMILESRNQIQSMSDDIIKNYGYTHILVDEFQDISKGRADLLKSVRGIKKSNLFCVGDDWQSINRFAGADVSNTLEFPRKFNMDNDLHKSPSSAEEELVPIEEPTKVFSVGQTHRCSKNISKLASNFITNNPFQLKKEILSSQLQNSPIHFVEMDGYNTKNICKLIQRIQPAELKQDIFIIYPFNRLQIDINFVFIAKQFPNFNILHSTIHRSKGLEADHIIILGLDDGSFGFPRLWGEDPLRNAFLPSSDQFQFSEERRLFYVAMTRAKDHLFICSNLKSAVPSIFFNEAMEIVKSKIIPYEKYEICDDKKVLRRCPVCVKQGKPGKLIVKTKNPTNAAGPNRFSVFAACNMFHPNKKGTYLYCEHADFGEVSCPSCIRNNKQGTLFVEQHDQHPQRRVSCSSCDIVMNYYDLHSQN